MGSRRFAKAALVVGIAALVFFIVSDVRLRIRDGKEQTELESLLRDWDFDPDDPSLSEARILSIDGTSLLVGFPTVMTRNGESYIDYTRASASFLDLGAQQIHMASKPDATLDDVPLGVPVKLRMRGDDANPGSWYIYDILVLEE